MKIIKTYRNNMFDKLDNPSENKLLCQFVFTFSVTEKEDFLFFSECL